MTFLPAPGEVGCPKRLWAGMARDACCAEQDAGLCPPDCAPGARARVERGRFLAGVAKSEELRRRLGYKRPSAERHPRDR